MGANYVFQKSAKFVWMGLAGTLAMFGIGKQTEGGHRTAHGNMAKGKETNLPKAID